MGIRDPIVPISTPYSIPSCLNSTEYTIISWTRQNRRNDGFRARIDHQPLAAHIIIAPTRSRVQARLQTVFTPKSRSCQARPQSPMQEEDLRVVCTPNNDESDDLDHFQQTHDARTRLNLAGVDYYEEEGYYTIKFALGKAYLRAKLELTRCLHVQHRLG